VILSHLKKIAGPAAGSFRRAMIKRIRLQKGSEKAGRYFSLPFYNSHFLNNFQKNHKYSSFIIHPVPGEQRNDDEGWMKK